MTKTVCITGGSRGIGANLAVAFARAGYAVFAGARSESGIEKAADGITFVAMDVRREDDHRRLVQAARNATGRLDCYINNAGRSAWRPIDEIDAPFLDDMLTVNLQSAFWGCKQAAATMGDPGVIINMSSLAARRGTPNNSAYCAAKFGITGLTQALAKELGPRGIRVNALCPVLVRTPGLIEALRDPTSPAKGDPDAFLENFRLSQSALGRLPTGVDVARLALFLASDAASAITGQSINVDCGVMPQ
jgi:3-oxoacyl-[acyl-carrier protein] reductase/meso-butanediol dehydrogenase/(S,S)-butanediol dehydrogenase/diacetyl reductase